jgi:beta-lactamase class A
MPLPILPPMLSSKLSPPPSHYAARLRAPARAPARARVFFTLLGVAALGGCQGAESGGGPGGEPGRAILVSIDALNEAILREFLTPDEAPALYRLFGEGVCAEHAISHFPSVTAASHATLWTGAYGDVTGLAGNQLHPLPRDAHTVLETVNGFHYSTLQAEPLWITAGRAGISVAGHHVTQAPGAPSYAAAFGAPSQAQVRRRAEAERVLASPSVHVMNGYNRLVLQQGILRGDGVRWQAGDLAAWEGLDALPASASAPATSALPPRPFVWDVPEAGPVYGLVLALADGEEAAPVYNALLLAPAPVVAQGVLAHAAPVESTPLSSGRELGQHFMAPLELAVEGGVIFLTGRLFEVAPDGDDFMFYHPPTQVVEANRADLSLEYMRAIGGWTGNSGFGVYRAGGFGPRLMDGGDGLAEARYLETAEHLTRQFNRGSTWLWETHAPRVMMDYFPLSDAIDHELIGYLDPRWPGYTAEQARQVRDFRARVWGLVDLRVAHLTALAEEGGAALFVSGDHGMRASWQVFHPNLLLEEAGLLVRDADGAIDLSQTRAAAATGYWISVNRAAYREGIVPPEEEAEVLAAVIEALEGARGPDGERIVRRIFTPDADPELGIGGPSGGDVYWGTAPGIRSSSSVRAAGVLTPGTLTAGHGFPPDEPDMFTVFCALGGGFEAGRIPAVRTTVVAPTVAEYAGIPTPPDAVAGSVLSWMRGGDPLEADLRALIDSVADSVVVGLAFMDLETGRTVSIGADRVFHAASTMKVPVLYGLARRIDEERMTAGTPILVTRTFRSVLDGSPFALDGDTDTELFEAEGTEVTARRLADGMITVSSNLATNLLLGVIPPDEIQGAIEALGAGGMRVRRGVSDIPAFNAGFSNETTPAGYLRMLQIVATCEGVTRASCRMMHEILEAQTYRDEIPAGIPAGVRIGNKTGFITRILHDGAIVWPEGRAPYLLVILTEGFTDSASGSPMIAALSRRVWEAVAEGM